MPEQGMLFSSKTSSCLVEYSWRFQEGFQTWAELQMRSSSARLSEAW
jgi:hypothetical protein